MKRIHAALVEAMVRENHLGEALIRHRPNLIDYIPAEGAAVLCGGQVTRFGRTPTDEQLCELVGWLTVSLRERWLRLRWTERGGPDVAQPTRMGFGRVLLERSLAYDVDGEVDLDFQPQGLVCTAMIPFEQFVERED